MPKCLTASLACHGGYPTTHPWRPIKGYIQVARCSLKEPSPKKARILHQENSQQKLNQHLNFHQGLGMSCLYWHLKMRWQINHECTAYK